MAEPELRVVHLDEALAVIDKPAGLVVHPAPSHQGPTLVDELGDILGGGEDPERPGIVHRLDKGTSGLLVVARGDEAHAALQAAVQRREVERVYLALAGGKVGSRTGTIDAPIGRASRQRTRMAVAGAGSREARTHFTVLELLRVVTDGGPVFLDAADGYAGRDCDLSHAKSALVAAVDARFGCGEPCLDVSHLVLDRRHGADVVAHHCCEVGDACGVVREV